MDQTFDESLGKSITRTIIFMLGLVVLLFGGALAWANHFTISGAVIASGSVVVETNVKHIQHQEGGVVKSILVDNSDIVRAGDVLLKLDDQSIGATRSILEVRLNDLKAQESRLLAERDRADKIVFDGVDPEDDVVASEFRTSQNELFHARKNRLINEKSQLREQIAQLENTILGYKAQLNARIVQSDLVSGELDDVRKLYDQKLVTVGRVLDLEREVLQLEANIGDLNAKIAQQRQAIAEKEILLLQVDENFSTRVLEALAAVQSEISSLSEELVAVNDQIKRLAIVAPKGGVIHDLAIHTIGAVVAPGERLLSIVPSDDELIIEVKIEPSSINQLYLSQSANLRFPSLDPRTTPELVGTINSISPDLLLDQITGQQFYQVRLKIPSSELSKLGEQRIVSGMPVEAFVKTADRTVLTYLIKPLADQIAHSMRER